MDCGWMVCGWWGWVESEWMVGGHVWMVGVDGGWVDVCGWWVGGCVWIVGVGGECKGFLRS